MMDFISIFQHWHFDFFLPHQFFRKQSTLCVLPSRWTISNFTSCHLSLPPTHSTRVRCTTQASDPSSPLCLSCDESHILCIQQLGTTYYANCSLFSRCRVACFPMRFRGVVWESALGIIACFWKSYSSNNEHNHHVFCSKLLQCYGKGYYGPKKRSGKLKKIPF